MLKICEIEPNDIGCDTVWLHDLASDYRDISISMAVYGQMMPIFVGWCNGRYVVIDGWKRLRAARDAGEKIQAVSWTMTLQSAIEFRASGRYVVGHLDYETLTKGPGVAIYDTVNDNFIAVPWDTGRRTVAYAHAYKLPYQWISEVNLASNYLFVMR